MQIKRDCYLTQLIDSMHNGFIKVITGMRRTGKSYLLFEIFYDYLKSINVEDNHIIKFAFDSQDYLDLIGEDLLELKLEKRKVDPKKFNNYIKERIVDDDTYYILLDEIQLLENFETVLNGYLRRNNLDCYVTGSNAKLLSKDVITEFRGRGWEIHINPLSFKEYVQVYDGSLDMAYERYATYGGLPKIFEFKNDAEIVKYLNNIFDETYLRDIVDRNKVVNDIELGELLNFIASSIGSLTNPTKLSNTFKTMKNVNIHPDTIKNTLITLLIHSLFIPQKGMMSSEKGILIHH